VFQVSDDLALVQTVDVLTPIVDDPFTFGQIAAANSLSDVYAMGGKPLTALNILGFPMGKLDPAIMRAIIEGGIDKVEEAGAVLCGGHSIKDSEIKYGLSITGSVHPEKIIANNGAKAGDDIILTKRIGTGIISTAIKEKKVSLKDAQDINRSMSTLNRIAAELMCQMGVHACTDVTGFGLIGHALEVAIASNIGIELETEQVPLFNNVHKYLKAGAYPGGGEANFTYCQCRILESESVDKNLLKIMLDPQTSGGLLIFIEASGAEALLSRLHESGVPEAVLVGHVTNGPPGKLKCL
jgi:selenide,water dikinase